MEAHAIATENPFEVASHTFGALVERLQDSETCTLSHSEVEGLIEHDGREVLRQLFQAHLDVRGLGDVGDSVLGSDGIARTRKRTRTRRLMSIFGVVFVTRLLYAVRDSGAPSLAPKDASLNLPRESYSHGVRHRVAELAAQGGFDRVVEEVKRTTGAAVPKRQAEELAVRAAVDFDQFYAEREVLDPAEAQGELLVITVDGKGIVMRPDSLTEATRKAAAKKTNKLRRRLTRGEKRNRKRMATVAAVYTIDPHRRTADEVVDGLRAKEAQPRVRPKPVSKRVWASVMKKPAAVIEQAFDEGLRRDPERRKRWVAVVDGNKTQLRLLRKAAKRHGVALTIVLDVIHVTEYLWKAARAFHLETDPAGETWVDDRLLRTLQGKSSTVAGGIKRSATLRKLSANKRKPADKAAQYLLKYREYLHYDEYLAAGLPIASGVIEGACRYLVKDRMDITGARWALEGAEAVLKLRALAASHDFDDYWAFHEGQEQARNHDVYYAGCTPPQLQANDPRGRPVLRVLAS